MTRNPDTASPAGEGRGCGVSDPADSEAPKGAGMGLSGTARDAGPDNGADVRDPDSADAETPSRTGPTVFFAHLEPYSSNLEQTLTLAHALAGDGWDAHILCRPECRLTGMAASLGLPAHAVPEGKGVIAAWRLLRILGKNGAGKRGTVLVHACDPTASQLVSLAWRMNGKLRVSHARRMPVMEPSSKVLRSYRRPPAKIITDSLAGKIALRLSGLEPHLLHTIACGIDPARQPARRDRGDGRTIFAVTGELTPQCGHSMLFDALPLLDGIPDLPSWEVRVLGGGPHFNSLLEEAAAKNVLGRLAFLPCLEPAEQLCGCDILVLPADEGESHMPLILQGWAARVPVVAINRLDHAEVLQDGINCLLAQPGDVAGLAGRMASLAKDPALRARLVQGGRASLAKFPLQAMVLEHKRLFGQILA